MSHLLWGIRKILLPPQLLPCPGSAQHWDTVRPAIPKPTASILSRSLPPWPYEGMGSVSGWPQRHRAACRAARYSPRSRAPRGAAIVPLKRLIMANEFQLAVIAP